MKLNKDNLLGFINGAALQKPMIGGKNPQIEINDNILQADFQDDLDSDEMSNIADNTGQTDSDNSEIA